MLGVRLTKYQQIHSDIQCAAHQMFTCLFTCLHVCLFDWSPDCTFNDINMCCTANVDVLMSDVLINRGRHNLEVIWWRKVGVWLAHECIIDHKFLGSVKIRAHLGLGAKLTFQMKWTFRGFELEPMWNSPFYFSYFILLIYTGGKLLMAWRSDCGTFFQPN